MTCDDPFQALAACHEVINAIDSGDPEQYECSLPVSKLYNVRMITCRNGNTHVETMVL